MPRIVVRPPESKKGQGITDNASKIVDELKIDRANDQSKIAVEPSSEFRVPSIMIGRLDSEGITSRQP
jgi:hypothetical protein